MKSRRSKVLQSTNLYVMPCEFISVPFSQDRDVSRVGNLPTISMQQRSSIPCEHHSELKSVSSPDAEGR